MRPYMTYLPHEARVLSYLVEICCFRVEVTEEWTVSMKWFVIHRKFGFFSFSTYE